MVDFALGRQSGRQLVGHDVAKLSEEFGTGDVFGGRDLGRGGEQLVLERLRLVGEKVTAEDEDLLDGLIMERAFEFVGRDQVQSETSGGSRQRNTRERGQVR